jgi:hypothetical protein
VIASRSELQTQCLYDPALSLILKESTTFWRKFTHRTSADAQSQALQKVWFNRWAAIIRALPHKVIATS